jgi:hypothetical protein
LRITNEVIAVCPVPFLAWPGLPGPVCTVACEEASETIGVNTPADLAAVERLLAIR